jgi:ABC-type uncharacterized transport system ATPase subunit
LMRVLAGHMAATSGSMVLDGAPVAIDRAAPGQRPAVGFLEQEGGLIIELTGVENLILAEADGVWSNRVAASDRLKTLAKQFGGSIDPDVPVLSLTMGQRQRLEILITLARGADILILDEPTASLSVEDAKTLGQIMRGFAAYRGSVFYISHKLNEVKEIADRITVMRRGKIVGRHTASAVSAEQLAAEMVGELIQSGSSPVSSLSGGNQQKLVLGRELEQMPRLLVAHNPFRGLDVRAIHDVRDAIFTACRAGLGAVMISSDLDELVQLAHRIVVLFAGRIAGES